MISYQATITEIGDEALLEEGLFILFKDNAPEDLRPYCILHNGENVQNDITLDSSLILGDHTYKIVAIGDLVSKNLDELGHITIHFKDSVEPDTPGNINVLGVKPALAVGDKILIQG